ncbi:MAG: TonB-dependent receptor [Bacteroidota bacterium]
MNKLLPRSFFIFFFILAPVIGAFCQDKGSIYGHVTNEKYATLELVNVSIQGATVGTTTNSNGNYELTIPANQDVIIAFSFVGYQKVVYTIKIGSGERKQMNQILVSTSTEIPTFELIAKDERAVITRIDVKQADFIPSPSGNGIEELVKKTSLGVYSNNELSSQYAVRGGNFDENLVYVNDIEIYRPLLQRSGQQEGLSFANSDLTSSVLFSSGGFDAKYGDKMSSVLDIQYKRPTKLGGSVMLSLLGASAHLEAASKNQKFTFLFGIRQKSNQYILNALQTKGQYKPSFTDVQLFTTYQINKKLEISFLGNYSRNKYLVVPESRETQFGTVQESYQLKIFFEGRELDYINTFLGALTLTYRPKPDLFIKWISSAYQTHETQRFDINGQYLIGRLEADFGKEDFGQLKEVLGQGTDFEHARDELYATVYGTELKGGYTKKINYLQWGVKYQHEMINDNLKEWEMLDSSGYTQPHHQDSVGYVNPDLQGDNPILLQNVINRVNVMQSNRVNAFVQNTSTFKVDSAEVMLTVGVRATYWDFNGQLCVSPRLTLAYKPHWKKDIVFRVSSGLYYQPPFYKEIKGFDGTINANVKAQQSIHVLVGSDWNFKIWGRPFKFVTEVYYKKLDNLNPYEIDNVKIQYFANNSAKGYATGIDFKINGEFVKGDESWLGVSLMQTREKIEGEYYMQYYNKSGNLIQPGYSQDAVAVDSVKHTTGYVPRPTDQMLNINVFFQDHFPRWPTFKIHLNLVYSSPLPFGPPEHKRYMDTLRMPSYFRVDLGFSKSLIDESSILSKKNPFRFIKSLWISGEVFNLFGRLNTISYTWVKDVNNRQYAVPNELTNRLFNIKLVAKF